MITKVRAGNDFSAFVSSTSQLFMFGSNSKGKLGLNSNISFVSEPSLIDSLSKIEVQDIALGYNHAICITK